MNPRVQCLNCLSYCQILNKECVVFRCWNCSSLSYLSEDIKLELFANYALNIDDLDKCIDQFPTSETQYDYE